MGDFSKYRELAEWMGATAVEFTADQICFDPRTLLKCLNGCPEWGRNHTCPSRPGNPSMAEYKDMFSRYGGGIVIGSGDCAEVQRITLAVESAAFHDGHYFAVALSECCLCPNGCAAAKNEPCRFPRQARMEFYSVGIDVYKTVRGLGLPIKVIADMENEPRHWYGAVFIE